MVGMGGRIDCGNQSYSPKGESYIEDHTDSEYWY